MTELIWEGKYDQDGRKVAPLRVALPFQTVETINESAKQRQMSLEAWSVGKTSEWRNRLIWGDRKYVLSALLEEFAGKVNLIYIDPPFDTGADFSFRVEVNGEDFTKEPSIIEQKAYRDTWGLGIDSYLQWFYETIALLQELLSDTGSLYVHMDWHVGQYAKVVLDEIFGADKFQNQIIWQKVRVSKAQSNSFGNVHDILYLYSKSANLFFQPTYLPYPESYKKSHYGLTEEKTGRRYGLWDMTQSGRGPSRRFGGKELNPPPGKHWIWSQERIDKAWEEKRISITSGGTPRLKRYLEDRKSVV
jgi:adenine-specific DNA-methyltransferase